MAYIQEDFFETCPFSDLGNAGTYYVAGFYDAPAAAVTLTMGATETQTYGTALYMKGAYVFAVTSGASAGAVVLTVSGISITDAGVRNDADSEVLIADGTTCAADQYYQTSKRWLGQVTYTLSGGSGGNALTFNYGFARPKSLANSKFTIRNFVMFAQGGASETGFNIELLHHKATGWTYSAGAFVPGSGTLCASATDYGTNVRWASGVYANYRRTGLTTEVDGTNKEGFIVRLTTAVNNSVKYGYARVGVTYR